MWPAPRATGPVRATVRLPGSKSQTNRELVLSALAGGPSRLTDPLRARDTLLMAYALRVLGVDVHDDGPHWTITPGALHGGAVDTGLAGTVMRFVPPLAALATGDTDVDGDAAARVRPMFTLLDGLRQLGADVDDGGRGSLPCTVHGHGGLSGGAAEIDASSSSQFVSALLLAGARCDKGVDLRHVGNVPVPSQTHVAMTVSALRARGVDVETGPNEWRVTPGPIAARDVAVEPDLSNAAPFLAAALVTGGTVTVPRWPLATTQAGAALRHLLTSFGADVGLDEGGLTVTGTGRIAGVEADLHDVGELTPVLAALAALGDGPSRLTGIAHLRGHETDRLTALTDEITALGGRVRQIPDGLVITPTALHGGTWRSYADHRMAQAGAVLGLALDGVGVEDIATTGKTLPDFPGLWAEMLQGAS